MHIKNMSGKYAAFVVLIGFAVINCHMYPASPTSLVVKKKTMLSFDKLRCSIVRINLNKNSFQEEFSRLMIKYDFVELVSSPNLVAHVHSCVITMEPAKGYWTTSSMSILSGFTLGLLPLYDPYEATKKITISYQSNNNNRIEKKYEFGASAVLWLPLILSAITESDRIEKTLERITDDFFYNELPKAGIQ